MEYLILALKSFIVFALSAAAFDGVHYILHVFEHSRFAFLRSLGALHAIHHDFLDREMRIQRRYARGNILHHVLPEYGTAAVGTILFGFVFGWLPSAIVLSIRTVMVIVYVWQKGEDFTHAETTRIRGDRSHVFVGPNYHALHHVYVRQYYSSFFNIFDLVFGTCCQIEDRRFLVLGKNAYAEAYARQIKRRGGIVGRDESQMNDADILILTEQVPPQLTDRFRDLGLKRLLPPEVWSAGKEMRSTRDLTHRRLHFYLPPGLSARVGLFFLKRGFKLIPG